MFMRISLFVASGMLVAACGSTPPYFAHTVPDKKVAGLTGESAIHIEQARGEVAAKKDAFNQGDFEVRTAKKDVEGNEDKTDNAADRVDAAADAIEATTDKQETEIRQAQAKRDKEVADAKARYNDLAAQIRERYAKQQAQNQATLATAKRTEEVTKAEIALDKAELAEAKARAAVRKQEINVAQAQLEIVKNDELIQSEGVVGPKETQSKLDFQAQLLREQKRLATAQGKLDAKVKATETAKGKLEQARARANGGAPKSE